jgi:glycosyltransferase involved in cell wall biosynthesis
VHSLGLSRVSSALFGQRHLKALLLSLRPDILHSQGLRADWLSSQLRHPLVRITTKRNVPALDYPSLMRPPLGYLAARVHERAFRNIPVVVSCAHSVLIPCKEKDLTQLVIHNGVDLELAPNRLGADSKAAERHRIGLPPRARIFAFSGPLIPRKNLLFLLSAFERRSSTDEHLIVLGDGPLRGACEDYAKGLQNISFFGNKPNIWDYLRIADYFVSPSKAEGMPNAVLEALASGLPVLLSDIPSHQEIVSLSPKAGELFNINDLASFDKAIDDLDKTPGLETNAITLVDKYFSADIMSANYQRLYRKLTYKLSGERPA